MAVVWSMLRRFVVGAGALIALTSAASAAAAVHLASAIEPYVWVENPLGGGTARSIGWHLLLTALFTSAVVLSVCDAGAVRAVRRAVAVAIGAIALLAANDAVVFYWLCTRHRIESNLSIPLSLWISLLAGGLAICVWQGRRRTESVWLAVSLDVLAGIVGAGALVLLHLVTFGSTDYTRPADVAIVLGAKVYSDGTPSTSLADRLRTGVELYHSGRVKYLLMTGGTGVEGCNEAMAMRDYALASGVPEEYILVDTHGNNTLASARNCRRILADRGLGSALLVSHYFHLARCKMLFTEQGISCRTVPAQMQQRLVYEPYFVLRECVAYLTYSVERPFRNSELARED